MGGNYKCSADRIDIIRTVELKDEDLNVRNPRCRMWLNSKDIQYPVWKRSSRKSHSRYNTNF